MTDELARRRAQHQATLGGVSPELLAEAERWTNDLLEVGYLEFAGDGSDNTHVTEMGLHVARMLLAHCSLMQQMQGAPASAAAFPSKVWDVCFRASIAIINEWLGIA